ncbi:hypothetical protein BDZ89DRAFT_567829 [Hymenopellis radicata]|nr:hypothetical protein BDZ89DRAFT_567829 [Hymenopellis radicata]
MPLPETLGQAGWIGAANGGPFCEPCLSWKREPLGPFPSLSASNDYHVSLRQVWTHTSTDSGSPSRVTTIHGGFGKVRTPILTAVGIKCGSTARARLFALCFVVSLPARLEHE